jgi:hypothetical protein
MAGGVSPRLNDKSRPGIQVRAGPIKAVRFHNIYPALGLSRARLDISQDGFYGDSLREKPSRIEVLGAWGSLGLEPFKVGALIVPRERNRGEYLKVSVRPKQAGRSIKSQREFDGGEQK